MHVNKKYYKLIRKTPRARARALAFLVIIELYIALLFQ